MTKQPADEFRIAQKYRTVFRRVRTVFAVIRYCKPLSDLSSRQFSENIFETASVIRPM